MNGESIAEELEKGCNEILQLQAKANCNISSGALAVLWHFNSLAKELRK